VRSDRMKVSDVQQKAGGGRGGRGFGWVGITWGAWNRCTAVGFLFAFFELDLIIELLDYWIV